MGFLSDLEFKLTYGDAIKRMSSRIAPDNVTMVGIDLKLEKDESGNIEAKVVEINGSAAGIHGYKKANGNEDLLVKRFKQFEKDIGVPIYVFGHEIFDTQAYNWIKPEPGGGIDIKHAHFSYSNGIDEIRSIPLNWFFWSLTRPNFPKVWKWNIKKNIEKTRIRNAEAIIIDRMLLTYGDHKVIGTVIPEKNFDFFNPEYILPVNLGGIEMLLRNKYFMPQFMKGSPMEIPSINLHHIRENSKEAKEFIDSAKGPYVVAKPSYGAHGIDVQLMKLEDLIAGAKPNWEARFDEKINSAKKLHLDYLAQLNTYHAAHTEIQHFVPGIPVINPNTGFEHSATMRYLVFMISNYGKIEIHPIGGYWRLAPKPLVEGEFSDAQYNANLTSFDNNVGNAIPIPITKDEQKLIERQLKQHLPKIYEKLLHFEPQIADLELY